MTVNKKEPAAGKKPDNGVHEGIADVHYEGSAIKRLLAYLKPHRKTLAICVTLVIALTVLDLYRPILIGDAIDRYITGSWQPGEEAQLRFMGVLKAAGFYVLLLLARFIRARAMEMRCFCPPETVTPRSPSRVPY